jgi:hypothetical protein
MVAAERLPFGRAKAGGENRHRIGPDRRNR